MSLHRWYDLRVLCGWLGACIALAVPVQSGAAETPGGTKALVSRSMPHVEGPASRACLPFDLVGTWELVAYGSPRRFTNPDAPYLYPYQVFQFTKEGALKSAHSPTAFLSDPHTVLQAIPASLTYGMHPDRKGVVAVKRTDATQTGEIWSCRAVTIDQVDLTHRTIMRRGDVVLTLLSHTGEPLFTRHLRRY